MRIFLLIALAGCKVVSGGSTSPGPSGAEPSGADPSASPPPAENVQARDGVFPMPDVTGKTREEAEAYLRSQGITGTITVDDNYVCHDPKVTELRVCTTHPMAGKDTRATLPLTIHLRPKGTATYDMPDLRGKSAEEAKQILMKLGQIEQRLRIETMQVVLDGCQPNKVCKQDPAPGTRTEEHDYKRLDIAAAE